MRFKHWLSSLFRRILSLLGMSDTPSASAYLEYPSTPIEVKTWYKQLFDAYRTRDDAYRLMKDVLVLEITHFKTDSGLEHENLVATTKRKQGTSRTLLRLDRWRQESDCPGAEGLNVWNRSWGGSLRDPRCVGYFSPASNCSNDRPGLYIAFPRHSHHLALMHTTPLWLLTVSPGN
jgi:hypothetical protein